MGINFITSIQVFKIIGSSSEKSGGKTLQDDLVFNINKFSSYSFKKFI